MEFEDIHHDAQSLIGNFQVATGRVILPYVNTTRADADFKQNIRKIISYDPNGKWIFIVEQLNTHKSESFVKLFLSDVALMGILGKRLLKEY